MKTRELADIITADNSKLSVIEITTGSNGYPQELHYGVIGFDSIEEAEEVAKKYDAHVVSFHQRDGWQLWEAQGNIYKPYDVFDIYGEDVNYHLCANMEDVEEEYSYAIDAIEEDGGDATELKNTLNKIKAEGIDDSQCVLLSADDITCYEIMPKTMMSYNYDTHNYAIGVELHNIDDSNE